MYKGYERHRKNNIFLGDLKSKEFVLLSTSLVMILRTGTSKL